MRQGEQHATSNEGRYGITRGPSDHDLPDDQGRGFPPPVQLVTKEYRVEEGGY